MKNDNAQDGASLLDTIASAEARYNCLGVLFSLADNNKGSPPFKEGEKSKGAEIQSVWVDFGREGLARSIQAQSAFFSKAEDEASSERYNTIYSQYSRYYEYYFKEFIEQLDDSSYTFYFYGYRESGGRSCAQKKV